jgi:hypothetical protein
MKKAVILTDGPHMLTPPTTRCYMRLQQLGYSFADMFSWQSLTRETGSGVLDEDGDPEREFDVKGIAEHILVLIERTEGEWTLDTLADALVFDNLKDYFTTLQDLHNAAFEDADPKADAS